MSQDKPKSQPPLPPESQDQTPQTIWNRIQLVVKAQSILALRRTIGVLEGVVEKIEAEAPAVTLPPSDTGERVSELDALASQSPQPSNITEVPATEETAGQFVPSGQRSWDKLQLGWSSTLAKIRSLLPENLNQKLSDTVLTGIIAGIAVIVVWTTSALLPEKPSEVANVPPSEQVPTANLTTPPELTAPAEPEPIEITPPPEPVPTPTPTLELTPEQNLIASIENQVDEITESYADGLIQSIQANFQRSRLIIKVGDDWYNLKPAQQDNLAARMLERARELDFSHLEITNPEGTLLARSPVVGTNMVILKRQVLSDQQSAVKTSAG